MHVAFVRNKWNSCVNLLAQHSTWQTHWLYSINTRCCHTELITSWNGRNVRRLHGDKGSSFSLWEKVSVKCIDGGGCYTFLRKCKDTLQSLITRSQHGFNKHRWYWQDCIFFCTWLAGPVVGVLNQWCIWTIVSN